MKVGLLTLNVGLLKFLGGRIQPVPYVEERLAVLSKELRRLNTAIVALQEIYLEEHRRYLVSQLQDVYSYFAYVREKPICGLENGLMVLSTMKLDFQLERFRASPVDEKLFACKGVLVCRIDGGGSGNWSLLNVHTTAGGVRLHPESKKANLIRSRQIDQILRTSDAEAGMTIIAGDLNAGPGVSEENFRQFLSGGFESAYDLMHESDSNPTWDPANPLNRDGPHRTSPPQRIDHVLIQRSDMEAHRLCLLSSDICCREQIVPTPRGPVTVSDHFGLCVELKIIDGSECSRSKP